LGEAARRRQQQAAVVGTFGEQPLDQLQAERQRQSNQLRVVVCRVGGAAVRQRVAQFVDGELLDRAAARRQRREQTERHNSHLEVLRQPCLHGVNVYPCIDFRATTA